MRKLAALAIVVAMAIAACGSDGDNQSSAGTSPAEGAKPGSAEAGFQPIEGLTYQKADKSTQENIASNFHESTGQSDPGYTDIDTENLMQDGDRKGYIVSLAFRPKDITTDPSFQSGVQRGFSSNGSSLNETTYNGKKILLGQVSGVYVGCVFKEGYVLFSYSPDKVIAEKAAAAQI